MRLLPALLALACAGTVQASIDVDRAATLRAAMSVLKIEVRRNHGGYGLGSGIVVATDKVVTNCHVTRDGVAIDVVRGGQRWRARAQARDAEHDLCVLQVPGLAVPIAALGNGADLSIGEAVLSLGYTGGVEMQRSAGRIVALHRFDGARVVQTNNAFGSGASGGGLFDGSLRLIGILTFRARGSAAAEHPGSGYYAAPVEWLLPLLADANAYQDVAADGSGALAYWEQPTATQPPFLQANALEREQRWDELETLAFNWTRADADNPRPWYLHGVALDRLQRWPESQRALEHALTIEPMSDDAWFRLGLVYAEQGRLADARLARSRLEGLQPERAAELGRVIDRR